MRWCRSQKPAKEAASIVPVAGGCHPAHAKGNAKEGKSYDCGSKSGFWAANIAYAMDCEDLRSDLLSEMKKYI